MRTIFLADAHLVVPSDLNYRILIKFLRELEGNTTELYILGDLFDFWVGFPSRPFEQYNLLIDALHKLIKSGCRLIYFEGNHDFHLGDVFLKELSAEVHSGPAIKIIQGKKLFLCHGDQINSSDYGYKFLRQLLRNPIAMLSVNFIPPLLAMQIKNILHKKSRDGYKAKIARWNYHEIIRLFATSIRNQGCNGLVCGHFHLGFCEELKDEPFTILSLGDWIEQFTYGEITDGVLQLKIYTRCSSFL